MPPPALPLGRAFSRLKGKSALGEVRPMKKKAISASYQRTALKGWQEVAHFLGQPVSVAQRWAKTGMPVSRAGKYVTAVPEELNVWLGREAGGEPVHVATEVGDLSAELKRGLAFVRQKK